MPDIIPDALGVKFIGRKPWIDRLYGSGLSFEPGQSRTVPSRLGRNFLRHADVFEPAEAKPVKASKTELTDDTDAQLQKAKEEKDKVTEEQNRIQDLHDRINTMTKDALVDFARVNYRQDIDKTKFKADELKAKVIGLVDQYGAV